MTLPLCSPMSPRNYMYFLLICFASMFRGKCYFCQDWVMFGWIWLGADGGCTKCETL